VGGVDQHAAAAAAIRKAEPNGAVAALLVEFLQGRSEAAVKALMELVRENYGERKLNISPDSIYTGALGAALFALRAGHGEEAPPDPIEGKKGKKPKRAKAPKASKASERGAR